MAAKKKPLAADERRDIGEGWYLTGHEVKVVEEASGYDLELENGGAINLEEASPWSPDGAFLFMAVDEPNSYLTRAEAVFLHKALGQFLAGGKR